MSYSTNTENLNSMDTLFDDECLDDIIEARLSAVAEKASQYVIDDSDEGVKSEPEQNDSPQVEQYAEKYGSSAGWFTDVC